MSIAQDAGAQAMESHSAVRTVYRKIAWRIVPFMMVGYVINQLDRLNISFARLRFMHDLGLTDMAYGFGAGLFFIGYVIFEVPSNVYLQRVGGRATFIRILALWGLVSAAMAFVRTPVELYIARFVLGAAEAGFVPGVILYLTYWFPSAYRARITSMFFMAITLAGMIGGPLSGWILKDFNGVAGLKDWQWLFILEGLPAIALGCMAYFFLDDRPDDAKWLTSAEKNLVRNHLLADNVGKVVVHDHALKAAFVNPRVYVAGLVYFSIIAGNNAMVLWLPTLIKGFGVDNLLTIGVLSSAPYIAGAIGMYLVSRHSDQRLERRWHVALALGATALSYILLGGFLSHPVAAISLISIAAIGLYSAMSIFWTIPPAYLTGPAAAGGIALVSSIGMMGGFFSPIILGWAKSTTGSLQLGFWAIAIVLLAGATALLLGLPAAMFSRRSDA